MNRLTKALADTASKILFRTAEVTAVAQLGTQFRSIELTGDALKKATWNVGDKIQIRTDPDGLTPGPTRPSRGTPLQVRRASWPTSMAAGPARPGPGP
jgi:hypothetical protein